MTAAVVLSCAVDVCSTLYVGGHIGGAEAA